MADHAYETGENGRCGACNKRFDDDAHMDHKLAGLESVTIKGPDGVVVWVTAVLGSTSVSVYEDTDFGPTVSYSSQEHDKRRRYINRLSDRIAQGPKTSGIDID